MFRRLFQRWRTPRAATPAADPIQTYDGLIDGLERQAAAIRKGAATLLSLRSGLQMKIAQGSAQLKALEGRLQEAATLEDGARLVSVLTHDREVLTQERAGREAQLARADADAALLLEAARELQESLSRMQAERQDAWTTLQLEQTLSQTVRARLTKVESLLALDAARDEVARAHALAELYREDG